MTRPVCTALSIALSSLAFAAAAQTPAPVPGTPTVPGTGSGSGIAAHKQKELAKIQERMQVLQTLQSCVNAATTAEAIKQCNATAHASSPNESQMNC